MLISGTADCQHYRVKPVANTATFVYNDEVNQDKFQENSPVFVYLARLIGMNSEKMLLKEQEVCQLIGFSKSTLWRMVGRGDFPVPHRFGKRMTRWNNWEIHNWISKTCGDN